MKKTQVLICGAGPTGLVLALWLTRIGIAIRIIDKSSSPGETSRALVVHARILEFYQQLGIQNKAIENGFEFKSANLWVNRKPIAKITFTDTTSPISPYQYPLIYPQDVHEKMLVDELISLGVNVERNTELLSFEQTTESVRIKLSVNDQLESCEVVYLAGCDGAHSVVRKELGFKFEGGTYDNVFYLADIEASGPVVNGEMHGILDDADFLAVFPMKGSGRARLVGTVTSEARSKEKLTWEDVDKSIRKKTPMEVKKVLWLSSYKVHHRVASSFKKGNVFLLGDAGHVHSPVGGQGMNTGIGDAVNLAWKMGAVLNKQSPVSVLETYEDERIAFARKLVATTDKAFQFANNRSRTAAIIRTKVAPLVAFFLFKLKAVRHFMFRRLSQIEINYRSSPLSVGRSGKLRAGDRLPWVNFKGATSPKDNFNSLQSLCWQVHCYGEMLPSSKDFVTRKIIPFHEFSWTPEMGSRALIKDNLYLIRPDGYIGLISNQHDLSGFDAYVKLWMILPSNQ